MNKTIKTTLLLVGIILLACGIYILNPAKEQGNQASYIIIASGFLSLILSLLKEKKK
ncbi:hypothetical protein [Polaribacter sp. Hel1_33_96]|uniref:hypothetical protein n=1 Tax=Polaribacter sp. Hel1_33_96 TaxID=1336805 RepID=UPI0015D61DF4|nr:hypothetical protein [Polaribacter sp. Hel1_33_96]